MNITPPPTYLNALTQQTLSWRDALGELIDNSLDVNATRIEIEFLGKTLTVKDDGEGCDDIARMLTLGYHVRGTHTKLGRYGVGLKDAAIWLAPRFDITTIHHGIRRDCTVDWDLLLRSATWDIEDPTTAPVKTQSGTVFVFRGLRKKAYPNFDALIENLGFVFMPALRSGKQIVFRYRGHQTVCTPYELPPLEHIVEDEFEVNGKVARLRAGVIKDGSTNKHPGFILIHYHRVIEETSVGANGYSTSQITGTVELDKKWDLGKNKSKLTDVDAEALGEAIYTRCREMLEYAAQRARNINLDNLTGKIQGLISDSLSEVTGKEQRHKGAGSGRVHPVSGPTQRTNVVKLQVGDKHLKSRSGSVSLDWNAYGDQRLGEVDLTARRITLNLDHPALVRMRLVDNADAIASLALTLFCVQVFSSNEESKFQFARDYSNIINALGPMLAGWKPDAGEEMQMAR